MKPHSLRRVKSADRVLCLFEALAGAGEPMKTTAISAVLDIPKSSLFHLLGTLEERGYVVQTSSGRYEIGPAIGRLASASTTSSSFLPVIEKALDDLCQAINETCGFYIEAGDHVEVIATRTGRQALSYTMQIGDRAPLYAVSAGKALLSQKDEVWLAAYLQRVHFEPFTPNTIRSHDQLRQEIDRTKSEGVGFVNEEFTPGIVGFGAVVRRRGSLIGAINVALPSSRFDPTRALQIRRQLAIAVAKAESHFA
ncbi:MAG: IclR family transcriptional regulator [Bradyrhizobium sp.]|nr:IclR family transcriptional regulator [Bradyrhizobium sp.]